ncbi:hypothetical protein SAMN04487826_1975 [Prevotella sp. khp1]|jgi:hypothetical protein|uniref:hypothetical protein n=1 Tax=Prevotellaceae TaxID=171552 RepID=UPI000891BC26|nr:MULTISPECIES: hypothetical protein [Prevotellaceae]QVJ81657.1 hypothetical protein J4031_04570 [Xylanibacter ruminicola]SDQ55744.1 hypothetical protein SAMN04487826_1975 [Prevotella sp. khp1]
MKQQSVNSECQNPIANLPLRKVRNLSLNDLPYEVWMKYLIKAYRRDLARLEQLQRYAEGLEEENVALLKKLAQQE